MRAARAFVQTLVNDDRFASLATIRIDLFGSLAATGKGHGTLEAVLLGLEGYDPSATLPDQADAARERQHSTGIVRVAEQLGQISVPIKLGVDDIVLRPLTILPRHTNGMRLAAVGADGTELLTQTWYSIGGGAVELEGQDAAADAAVAVPHPFTSGAELLQACDETGMSVAELMLANECASRPESEVRARLSELWEVMEACKDSAIRRSGALPGGLQVRRRSPAWHTRLRQLDPHREERFWQEWTNLVALAVNEENASGGRIVTAPTNGAAGIIPAVLFYATHYLPGAKHWDATQKQAVIADFLLAAAAIGGLIKRHASISGAEVGCQGEVGSASAMAAAGLAQVLGGTPAQVENAAEIAMEHHLGLTCDPIAGLVQIPCIERNAIAASTAVNAAKMAMMGDGSHFVSLDDVIVTMRETGRDMSAKYKETALGGLAVNVVEC